MEKERKESESNRQVCQHWKSLRATFQYGTADVGFHGEETLQEREQISIFEN
jgi:hypothetical protein